MKESAVSGVFENVDGILIGFWGKPKQLNNVAMSEYSQIVCDLLEARRSEPSATEVFMKLKHDKDLCPAFRKQIERIFSAFKKYHNVSYDIQGVVVLFLLWLHLFQNQTSASAEEIMQSPIIHDLHQTLSREAEHLFYDFE